jgi:hypothetical protein
MGRKKESVMKTFMSSCAVALGLAMGLSACTDGYGYNGSGYSGYGSNTPSYYAPGYGSGYHGPGYGSGYYRPGYGSGYNGAGYYGYGR